MFIINFIKDLPSNIRWRSLAIKYYIIGSFFRAFPNLAIKYIENKLFKLMSIIITDKFTKNIDLVIKESKKLYILMNIINEKLDYIKLLQLMLNKHKIITPIRLSTGQLRDNVDYTCNDYFQQIINYYLDKENHLDKYLNEPIDICFVLPLILNINPNDEYNLQQVVYIANESILEVVDVDDTLFSSYTKLYNSLPEKYKHRYKIQCKVRELEKLLKEYHEVIDNCNYNDTAEINRDKILTAGRKIYDYLENNMDEYNGYYLISVLYTYVNKYLDKGHLLGYSKVDKLGKKKVEFGYYISTPILFVDDNDILSSVCLRYFNREGIDVENEDITEIDKTELMVGVTNHISILTNEYGDLLELLDIDEDEVNANQSYMYVINEDEFIENYPYINIVGKNPVIIVINDEDYRDNERIDVLNYVSIMMPIKFHYFESKTSIFKKKQLEKTKKIKNELKVEFTDEDFKSIEDGMHNSLKNDINENKSNKNNILNKDDDDDDLQPV